MPLVARAELIEQICAVLETELIQNVGQVAVLFRRHPETALIHLPPIGHSSQTCRTQYLVLILILVPRSYTPPELLLHPGIDQPRQLTPTFVLANQRPNPTRSGTHCLLVRTVRTWTRARMAVWARVPWEKDLGILTASIDLSGWCPGPESNRHGLTANRF
jgi:hypothetical protein